MYEIVKTYWYGYYKFKEKDDEHSSLLKNRKLIQMYVYMYQTAVTLGNGKIAVKCNARSLNQEELQEIKVCIASP